MICSKNYIYNEINFHYRIVFKFCTDEASCLQLINIGTHDEVY